MARREGVSRGTALPAPQPQVCQPPPTTAKDCFPLKPLQFRALFISVFCYEHRKLLQPETRYSPSKQKKIETMGEEVAGQIPLAMEWAVCWHEESKMLLTAASSRPLANQISSP